MTATKIFNDPVYGFIRIPKGIIFNLVEHPYFQRLRRIKQLGMTHLVYPGALHNRFQHALGSLHLMISALDTLRLKGVEITDEEYEAACIAILLHDIGHGPFSHALEKTIADDVHHEQISLMFMNRLNEEYNGKLSLAIDIFKGAYEKKFLHQLVSSQLDADRLDYLRRDSFYTGVIEGAIGSDRIIMMLDVHEGNLVAEAKGIYSIEKFLLARRLMYWQVYLHKTVVSAEQLLIQVLKRAKAVAANGQDLFASEPLRFFLYNKISDIDFQSKWEVLDTFARLDDYDVMAGIKSWVFHKDAILSVLCRKMINRDLFKIRLENSPIGKVEVNSLRSKAASFYGVPEDLAEYFVFSDEIENSTYSAESIKINILTKSGEIRDITEVSDQYDLKTVTKKVKKYLLCYPKEIV